jgi:hypothetical protein
MGQPSGRVHFSKDFAVPRRAFVAPATCRLFALRTTFVGTKKIRRKRGGVETKPN